MGSETDLNIAVVGGTLMIFTLIMVIITFVVLYNKRMIQKDADASLAQKNNELELVRAVLETQENEREKIAGNLHDDIGPLLTAHKLNLSLLKLDLKEGKLLPEKISESQLFLDVIINNVRSVSHDLAPHFLLKNGLVKGLHSFLTKLPIETLEIDLQFDDSVLSKSVVVNTYRMVLELVNNVIKHDTPSQLSVKVFESVRHFEMVITHNGEGITNSEFEELVKHSTGLGVSTVLSRKALIQADLSFDKMPNGARISLIIPIHKHE